MFLLWFPSLSLQSYKFKHIDGSIAKKERQREVDDFQKNNFYTLFFVSKQAGGTGLNITAADRVLILEPHWNPMWDLQSQDRAHRLGQKRVVKVYRLLVEGTVEEYQLKTQLHKNQLSNRVLDDIPESALLSSGEIGNMSAMLRVHKSFAESANVELIADEKLPAVAYDVCEDLGMDQAAPKVAVACESLFAGESDCLVGAGEDYLNVEIDDDLVEFGGGRGALRPKEEQDCSVPPPPFLEDDHEDVCEGSVSNDAVDSTLNTSDKDDDVADVARTEMTETQQTEMLLDKDSKFIVSTNEEKNRRQHTLLQQPGRRTGGVNCDLDAVNHVNLEDSQPSDVDVDWHPLPPRKLRGSGVAEAADKRPFVDSKATREAGVVGNSRAAKRQRSDLRQTERSSGDETVLKRSRGASETVEESARFRDAKTARRLKRAEGSALSSDDDDDDIVEEVHEAKERDAHAGKRRVDSQSRAKLASSAKPPASAAAAKPKKAAATKAAATKAKKAPAAKKNPFGSRKKFTS